MKKLAIIYDDDVKEPEWATFQDKMYSLTIVAVSGIDQAKEVTRKLVGKGITRIQLCGMFGVQGQFAVEQVVTDAVPVEIILYGIDSITQVAAYKASFEAGEILNGALVAYLPNYKGEIKQVIRKNGEKGKLIISIVRDEKELKEIATKLLKDNYTLFELYGKYTYGILARFIDYVNGAAAIGALASKLAR